MELHSTLEEMLGLFFTNPHTGNRNVLTGDPLNDGTKEVDTELSSSYYATRSV